CCASGRYHGDQKDCSSGSQAQCSGLVSYLGRRCCARGESPSICSLERVRGDGAGLHLQSAPSGIVERAAPAEKRFYDSARQTGTWGGTRFSCAATIRVYGYGRDCRAFTDAARRLAIGLSKTRPIQKLFTTNVSVLYFPNGFSFFSIFRFLF